MAGALRESKQPLVRIDAADKAVLDVLASRTGESTPKLLHKAVSRLRKQMFYEQMSEGYGNLREDTKAWQAELEDRALFENAIADGLNEN